MKKILLAFALFASILTMVMTEAHARRMGGGMSFGRQSQNVSRAAPMQQRQQPAVDRTRQTQNTAAKPATGSTSRFGGMLGGALLGFGLGALLVHMGMGAGLANMIGMLFTAALIIFAISFVRRMLARKQENASDVAYAGNMSSHARRSTTPEIGSGLDPAARNASAFQAASMTSSGADPGVNATWGIPADFEMEPFLRAAKSYFIRMQAAWDKANIDDLLEFTTPEMYAELKLQIQERSARPNATDVVTLDAELMGIETVGNESLASVRFTGTIRESGQTSPEPFTEVWNLTRTLSGKDGWVLAGIQQVQ